MNSDKQTTNDIVSTHETSQENGAKSIQRVRVHLEERSYDIEIGVGNLSTLGAFLTSFGNVKHVVLFTDENVVELYAQPLAEHLAEYDMIVDLMVIEPGEESKAVASAEWLWEKLLEIGTDRHTVIIAVGGGVIGDLAGFVAATYVRGIRFFQVPTTLLAQVDSSVGGKVGVNLSGGKNMVGAFHQPFGVLIDTKTLDTLDDEQYLAGIGEVVKYGVSLDAELFEKIETSVELLKQRDHRLLKEMIASCCRLKVDIVERDEREILGMRAKLNYGHTFAHAYETLAGYGHLLHGMAVAIGLVDAAKLAAELGRVDQAFVKRQIDLNEKLGLPVSFRIDDAESVINLMLRDKKTQHGKLRMVLPSAIGQCDLVSDVSLDVVKKILTCR